MRDERGRFVSATAQNLLNKSAELEQQAQELILAENKPPTWLKAVVVYFAEVLGITPEEFGSRIRIQHPTSADPVLLVDDLSVVSWI